MQTTVLPRHLKPDFVHHAQFIGKFSDSSVPAAVVASGVAFFPYLAAIDRSVTAHIKYHRRTANGSLYKQQWLPLLGSLLSDSYQMIFIYKAYKNNKEKKAAQTELPHYDRKLTDPSLDGSIESRSPPSIIAMPQQDVPTPEMAMPTQTLDEKKAARKQWIILGVTLFVDIVIPLVLYYILKNYISLLAALLISSAPPIIMIVGKFIIYRQFDPLGLIIVFGFVLSAILSVVDSNPRIILLKDSIVSSATGLIFLLSLLPLRFGRHHLRPLTYGISAEMMSAAPKVQYVKDGEFIEQTPTQFSWEHVQFFRNDMRMLTAMWGIVLLLEFVARLIMYFSPLTIDQLVLYSNIVLGCLLGSMGVFTIIYSHHLRTKTRKAVQEILARFASEAVTSSNAGFTDSV